MTQGAIEEGADVLAVMGGDGIMHLGVNTAAAAHLLGGRRTALGLIPAGTGNDLCRGIGLDPHDAVAAAGVIAAGHSRSLDLAQVGDTYVGGVLATGFDALGQIAGASRCPGPGLDPICAGDHGGAAGVHAAEVSVDPRWRGA